MEKFYILNYIVNLGFDIVPDTALVKAVDEESAKKSLIEFIETKYKYRKSHDVMDAVIKGEFNGCIFTDKCGYKNI